MCEQLRVLDKGRLERRRGALSRQGMGLIERALLIALDLPDAP
jgi:mRNA-degrading endonuclease toxin of MazEF toxin-antitoxin module